MKISTRKSQRKSFRSPIISDRFPHPPANQFRTSITGTSMRAESFVRRRQIVLAMFAAMIAVVVLPALLKRGHAQSNKLTLISEETSTRAIAVDSVTLKREPFKSTSDVTWGNDNRTRV